MAKTHVRPGCWARILRVAGIAAAMGLVALIGLAINQQIGLRRGLVRYPPPGAQVAVDGRLMHLHCTGEGAPTVVIDAGNGSFSVEWTPIQEQLQADARVCTTDRAGYGWSEPGPTPRDGARVVDELHVLLQEAGEAGPYLLVGHSLGGVHARIYALRYPDEVAGLVLVDTAAETVLSPEMEGQMRASIGFYQGMRLLTGSGLMRVLGPLAGEGAMPENAAKLPPALRDAYLERVLDPRGQTTAIAEMSALPQTLAQAQGSLGDRPLIVLTAGQRAAPGSTPFSPKLAPADPEVIAAQRRLAGLSSRGEQRVVEESGHLVHLDAPEAVADAVRDLLAAIRGGE